MGLAIRSACCCCSLRQACLILLYTNFGIFAFGLLVRITSQNNPSYLQYYENNPSEFLHVIHGLLECVILLITIITIYQKESSQCWLSISTWILVLESVYIVCSMIMINVEITPKSEITPKIEITPTTVFEYDRTPYLEVLLYNVISILALALELSSALVCYSYMEELRRRPVYGIPTGQNNITGHPNAAFPTVPYPAQPYPAQPYQYIGLPPQFPIQIAQNPDVPPEYCMQPAQNPHQIANYPNQPFV